MSKVTLYFLQVAEKLAFDARDDVWPELIGPAPESSRATHAVRPSCFSWSRQPFFEASAFLSSSACRPIHRRVRSRCK